MSIWYEIQHNQIGIFDFTSMLVTDVEDQICWWQVWDVVDFHVYKVTNIKYLSTSLSGRVGLSKRISIAELEFSAGK